MTRFVALTVLFASVATAHAKPTPPTTPDALGPPSKAVTPEIVDAIVEEMNRDKDHLVLPGAPPPYSISYKITEVEVNEVVASLGETVAREPQHFVGIEAHVRVGSPDLDNGNFVVPENPEINGTATIQLPLEATPRIAKRQVWLATDTAYKKALIQLRARLEYRHAGGSGTVAAGVPAWTATKPVVSDAPVLVAPLDTLADLEARAKAISGEFRGISALREAHVALTSYLERRWYLDTDRTRVTDTRRASGLIIEASGQASDGQLVHDYFMRYGTTAKDLPTDDQLKTESKRLAASIVALEKAPLLEQYSGPILFEGEGAVGIVRATLVPNLGGTPVPEGLNAQEAKQVGGAFDDVVGKVALSSNLSIVDDPTTSITAGKALIGGYKVDDEGVAAERVQVVKDGWLKTLLTSRTPSRKGQLSNGHARRLPPDNAGGAFQGSATNLFVIGRGGTSRKALEQKLVALARANGNPYGLVIRRFDDFAVTSEPDFTRRELVQLIKTADQDLPPPAVLAYKLFPDGHEELVRGVQLKEVPVKSWKDVVGVSNETFAYNFLQDPKMPLTLKIDGVGEGFVPSSGIESAVVTPDLLFKDLDARGSSVGERALPVVAQPPSK